jgi:phospholipase D-like protein
MCRLAHYPLQLILRLYVATSGDIFKAHLKTVGCYIHTEEKTTMINPFSGLLYFLFLGRNGLLTIAMIFWIWVIYECVTKESSEGNDKVAWLLFILFVPVVGALIYYFVRRPERIKSVGQ